MRLTSHLYLVVLACGLRGNASTLIVDLEGAGDSTDIQSAIDAAGDGDTVLVRPGEYVVDRPIDFNRLHSALDPSSPRFKNIVLVSERGPDFTTIRMADLPENQHLASVVDFSHGEDGRSVLEGFELTGGHGRDISDTQSTHMFGGGIHCFRSSPRVVDCTIRGNGADSGGGVGLWQGSSPVLDRCRISSNSAGESGGGVRVIGKGLEASRFLNCVVSGNRCGQDGGGFSFHIGTDGLVANCVITGNVAASGGGMYLGDRADPRVVNCIVENNEGGSVLCGGTTAASLINCIVRDQGDDPVCGRLSDCQVGADPLFVVPGHFSGDAWVDGDYHLQPDSPAIDAGILEGAPVTDLEGHGRPCGAGVDIGAYEMGECAASGNRFLRGDVDGNGTLEITDPIALLGYLFLGDAEPGCIDSADADDSGTVDITDAIYSLSFLFQGGRAPPSPYPECGLDPLIDGLGCLAAPGCRQ